MGATKTCPYCAEEIKAEAIRCKHCSAELGDRRRSGDDAAGPGGDGDRGNPVRRISFVTGLAMSLGLGFLFIIIGVGLTLTVIGAILGIPLVIIGVLAAILSPLGFLVISEWQCPRYDTKGTFLNGMKAVKCAGCKSRFAVRDGYLVRIPNG